MKLFVHVYITFQNIEKENSIFGSDILSINTFNTPKLFWFFKNPKHPFFVYISL